MPPTGFVAHYPHPDSRAKRTWSNVKEHKLHQQMDNLYSMFLKELNEKYGTSSDIVTPLCTNNKKCKNKYHNYISYLGKYQKESESFLILLLVCHFHPKAAKIPQRILKLNNLPS